ncbi:protein translocase subunit SecD [Anatilimnocola floriformis]|uniref:protein translocase subunit SecD n=1 Tax=Anatilimnocola floriformis TaxID=2948575 RepID=UPI0020C46D92|nr:protein translocase subunit SecD [Anatilimnocola floriformis]
MLSPFFLSLLAAENRILEKLPPIFGLPTELLLPLVLIIVSMILGVMYGKSIRMEDHGWKLGLIAASFLASLAIILFWEYKLGVDLQGGAILVYEVDEKLTADNHPQGRADDWKMSDLMEVLKRRLNPDGLKEIVIRPFGPKQIEIVVPEVDAAEIEELKNNITNAGVLRFLILADNATRDGAIWDAAREQLLSNETRVRMDRNVKDPNDPKEDKRIIGFWAEVKRKPGTAEPQDFVEGSALSGLTLLRDGDTGVLIPIDRTVQDQQEFGASPVQFFYKRGIKKVQVLMACDPEVDIRGSDLASASESMDESGRPCIDFQMKVDSVWKMSEMTGSNRPVGAVTRKLGIIWDGVLESAPSIQSQINQRGQITGAFSHKEVREKVELLRSGSMPVVLSHEPISDDRIGATLGADTVRKGSSSIMIALAIVFGFVMFYYRTGGAIACFALGLNLLLTVALMFAMRAPFTLPGLAGLVLTVGMSVDSNVLVYERLREEMERGASLRMAIRNGFDKAFVTIVDSNVTVLLTSIILYVIGTDQVRGFGMTVMLGVITSMFTGVFASRVLLEVGEKAYRWTTMGMVKWFTHPNIDWMKLFIPTSIASAIIIVIGLVGVVARGAGILDVDLNGGTSVQFVLDPKEYPDPTDPEVREILEKAFDKVKVGKDGKLADTGDSVEHNVYQTFSGSTADGEKGKELKFWKVDSSLTEVADLQKVVRDAFRKDGREGIQTYALTAGEIKEVAAETPVTPPALPPVGPTTPPDAPDSPKLEAPKNDPPKVETPKTETPKTETPKEEPKAETPTEPKKEEPKAETPKTETPKAETPKADEPKKSEGEDSSDCQPAEEKKDEPKKEEAKSDDKKPEDPKPEPAATEPAKPEPAKPEPTKVEPVVPAVDPAGQIPPVPPVVPAQPAKGATARSQVQINLESKINANALLERISAAAEKTIGRKVSAELSARGWNGVDNSAYTEWQISLPLAKDDASKTMVQLEQDLEKEPVWQTSSKIGGQVAGDTQYRALFAIIGSLFVMILYMWIRFHKISWGIAAAVALAHDALVMLGAIAISYWLAPVLGFMQVEEFKISLPVVAAFLTLIGYSVNDTIVIFDRVRELRGKSPVLTGQMVNDAVNQTLSRTFLTGGLTLVVVIILYFFGGSGIHAFAFSLVVGVISGSYSTVFIAAPLLVYLIGLDQEEGQKKKLPPSETRGAA